MCGICTCPQVFGSYLNHPLSYKPNQHEKEGRGSVYVRNKIHSFSKELNTELCLN